MAVGVPAVQAKPAGQKVADTIRHATGSLTGQCRFEAHRIAMLEAGEALNGQVGYSFEVKPATVGQRFLLGPQDGAVVDADLDIAFYESLGDPADPLKTPDRMIFDDVRGSFSVERGRVPKDLPVAIVCLFAAETPAQFTYVTGPEANLTTVLYP
jgi:hypothetical protein